jgi:hypothetical protein
MLQRPDREIGMLSKTLPVAITALTAVLFTSCVSLPWQGEAPAEEVNLAFTIRNNLLFLTTAQINNQSGRIFFGSAHPRTILDPAFAARVHGRRYTLDLNQRDSLPFTPIVTPLGGIGDALVGADVWGGHAVTINYRSGLLTYQKDGIYPDYMTLYRFEAEPMIEAEVDGRAIPAVLDTALPDTLVLPRGSEPAGRKRSHVTIAGTDFGNVDVALGDVSQARVGNRLLSKFLISVDYGRRQVGLWRDPRIPM